MSAPTETTLDFRNTNSLWCSILVETLARLGLRQAVISPGSRSAPLTFAFARHPEIEALPVLDERSAAFFALGLAKQQGVPVALVCTSGTAGANFFPAVIEARESGVPLLVLTADRPPEMRDCGSGQTIDQQKLYGQHVNFYHEMAAPEATLSRLRYLRQTVAHAMGRTLQPAAGPVHLNCPFRDPLPPIEDGSAAGMRGQIAEGAFFSALDQPPSWWVHAPAGRIRLGGRGLLVAGPAEVPDPAAYARVIGRLSRRLGWPVLADGLSPLRNHRSFVPNLITTYDLAARSDALTAELAPDWVVVISAWPTSKTLRRWLEQRDPQIIFSRDHPENHDALHGRTRGVTGPIERLAEAVQPGARARGWAERWRGVEQGFARRRSRVIGAVAWKFEGKVAALLPGLLPAGTSVFVANSMPVRDVEYFWPANDRGHRLFFNRGANGIDGTLSTALGVAHGAGQSAILLTGDLALLHDTNGFLTRRRFRGSLTIILVNNNGGGIFEHLPVAKFEPPFEEFFATPQDIDFKKLCATYGAGHTRVRDWKHFAKLVAKLPARGVRVLELNTDRKRDAVFRQELLAQWAAAKT